MRMNTKINIGITGIDGFLGTRLADHITRTRPEWGVVPGHRELFASAAALAEFAASSCAIVHFAGLSRHADGKKLYRINMDLARKLFDAAASFSERRILLLASTTHERDLPYHRSKRDAEALFSRLPGGGSLRLPNAFGPGGKPFYNSVVATFCFQLVHGETPEITQDAELELAYADFLAEEICVRIEDALKSNRPLPPFYRLPGEYHCRVSELLARLKSLASGGAPADAFDRDLAVTLEFYRKNSSRLSIEGSN